MNHRNSGFEFRALQLFSALVAIGSAAVMVHGLYYADWWAGLGLVFLMTSGLMNVAVYLGGVSSAKLADERREVRQIPASKAS